jgi:UrcA family protein
LKELIMNKQIKNGVMGVAVAAAMLVGVAQGAEVATKTVSYQDLNLNTQAGVQVLYKRIHGAANQVCGNFDARDLQVGRAHKACVDRAVADAVATVNNQMLTKAVTVAQVR